MQIPDNLLDYAWAKGRTVCVALLLLKMANWPKKKECQTSVLELAGKLGWSWRAVNKDIVLLEESGFISLKLASVRGIKKLDIVINNN